MPQHAEEVTKRKHFSRTQKIIAGSIMAVVLIAGCVTGAFLLRASQTGVSTATVDESAISDTAPISDTQSSAFPTEGESGTQGQEHFDKLDETIAKTISATNVDDQAKEYLDTLPQAASVESVTAVADYGAVTFVVQAKPDMKNDAAQQLADSLADWFCQQYKTGQWGDTWKDDPQNARVHVNVTTTGNDSKLLASSFIQLNNK